MRKTDWMLYSLKSSVNDTERTVLQIEVMFQLIESVGFITKNYPIDDVCLVSY